MQCLKFKNFLYSIFFIIQLLVFLLTLIMKNEFKYTNVSKLMLNTIIIILLSLLVIQMIYPKILCNIITKNLGIIKSNKGQGLISLSIGIIFITSHNISQVIFCLFSIGIGGIIEFIELSRKKIDRKQVRTTETNLNLSKESRRINGRTLNIRMEDELNSKDNEIE